MASPPQKQVLQKPPGFRDPAVPVKPFSKKPVLPPSLRPKKGRRCCRRCCCFFCVIFLVLFFFLVVLGGLIYVIYDPHPPIFHLQSFRIHRLNVTDQPDGLYLDAQSMTRVEVKNPNSRMQWYFGETVIQVSADDEDLNLGSDSIPGFTVKELEVTSLKAETSVKGQPLDDSHGKNLKIRFKNKEIVPSVDVRTKAGVLLEGWKIGTLGINVICGNVSLKKLESGEIPTCTIDVFRWFKV